MAHFVELDNNNIVIRGIVVNNNELLDENGNEVEQKGIDFCKSLFGENTRWIQTSYNKNFRQHYASAGFTYDVDLDVFIPPKPYPNWKLNYQIFEWVPPIPKPDDVEGYVWRWSEPNQEWIQFVIE